MKNKLSIKNKTLISALSVLSASSAIWPVVSLSSCSKSNSSSKLQIGQDLDKEYNINESSYIALKEKFKQEWKNKVTAHDDWSDEKKAKEIENLNSDLATFDKSFNNKSYNLSFTWKSQAIINFALQHYGINISRDNLSVTWSDIYNVYQGYVQTFKDYMKASGLEEPEINLILQQADQAYDDLINGKIVDGDKQYPIGLKAKYADPLAALIEAKSELISCFAHVNDSIALLSAVSGLKKFFQTYNVVYHQTDSNLFDQLVDSGILSKDKIGTDLSSHMMEIFKITDTLHPDREIKTFDGTKFIPGFTIRPILKAIETNRFTNNYAIKIDWQCFKSEFADDPKVTPDKLSDITGHLYDNAAMPNFIDPQMDDFDAIEYMKTASVHLVSYSIPLSAAKEKEALESAYFTGQPFKYDPTTISQGRINLGWFSELPVGQIRHGYDAFYQGKKIDDQQNTGFTHYRVNFASLIDADIEFKYAEANSNSLSEPYKVSDFFASTNTGVIDTTEKADMKKAPLILDTLAHNCTIYSDALVKNDDWDNREAYNTLHVFYKNSQYAHRLDANIYDIGEFNTSGFGNSVSSYKWLTNQYNQLYNTIYKLSNNDYEERWMAAKSMCVEQSIFLTLTSALSLLCIIAASISIYKVGKKLKVIVFVVDLILTIAIEGIDIWRYAHFMKHYYFKTKNMYDAAEKLKNSAETKNIKAYLEDQKQYFGIVRADENYKIQKADFDANYDKYFKNLDPKQLKERMDEFANIQTSELMVDFLNKVAEEGPAVKTYEEYMKEWEANGKYQLTSALCGQASGWLCSIQLAWMLVCGLIGGKDEESEAVKDTAAEVADQDKAITKDLSSQTTGNSPNSNGNTSVGELFQKNENKVDEGGNPIIKPEESGNAGPEEAPLINEPEGLLSPADGIRQNIEGKPEISAMNDYYKSLMKKYNKNKDLKGLVSKDGKTAIDAKFELQQMVNKDLMPKIYKDKDILKELRYKIVTRKGEKDGIFRMYSRYDNIFTRLLRKFGRASDGVYNSTKEFYNALKDLATDKNVSESLLEGALKGIDKYIKDNKEKWEALYDWSCPIETLSDMYKAGKENEIIETLDQLFRKRLFDPYIGDKVGQVTMYTAGEWLADFFDSIIKGATDSILDVLLGGIRIVV
ncbi:MAG: hypothetical protein ACOQNV_02780 [Mycoplasmoidaceae bacterium]